MPQDLNMRRLRCFIASAFGYADVDRVFTRLIRPTLSELGITTSRVDYVVHNDDIDDKIFDLLNSADLCIADLTYARPSVYFEAGYVSPTKPVIFIARKDHFKARDSDPNGNLRVHFDLQMKNIIAWGQSDQAFCRALRRRVKLVTRPLIDRLQHSAESAQDAAAFQALPQSRRIGDLAVLLDKVASTHGFKRDTPIMDVPGRRGSAFFRRIGQTAITVHTFVQESFTLSDLRTVRSWYAFHPWSRRGIFADEPRSKDNRIIVSIVVSLSHLSRQRLARRFPSHALLNNNFLRAVNEDRATPMVSLIAPVSGITSPALFKKAVDNIFDTLCSSSSRRELLPDRESVAEH